MADFTIINQICHLTNKYVLGKTNDSSANTLTIFLGVSCQEKTRLLVMNPRGQSWRRKGCSPGRGRWLLSQCTSWVRPVEQAISLQFRAGLALLCKPWHYMTWYWVTLNQGETCGRMTATPPKDLHPRSSDWRALCAQRHRPEGMSERRVITVSLFGHMALTNHRTQYTGFWIRTCTAVKFNKVTQAELPGYLI